MSTPDYYPRAKELLLVGYPHDLVQHLKNHAIEHDIEGRDEYFDQIMQDIVNHPKHNFAHTILKMMLDTPELDQCLFATSDKGLCLLAQVGRLGRMDMFEMLVAKGASISVEEDQGLSVLKSICQYENHPRLQEACMDVALTLLPFTKSEKDVALSEAIDKLNAGAVKSLLRHGASCFLDGGYYDSSLQELVKKMVEISAPEAQASFNVILDTLLTHKKTAKNIDYGWKMKSDSVSKSPLHMLVSYVPNFDENFTVLKKMLVAGAQPNPPEKLKDLGLKIPLMEAAFYMYEDPELVSVKMLLEHGADPHAIDTRGRSVLHWMSTNEHVKGGYLGDDAIPQFEKDILIPMAQLFISLGVDPCLKDRDGHTPSDLAQKNLCLNLAHFLQNFETQRVLSSAMQPQSDLKSSVKSKIM